MLRFYFRKFTLFALPMILAFSIVILIGGSFSVGLFKSESFVSFGVERNKAQIIETIDGALDIASQHSELPEEAFEGAVNNSNFPIISQKIAKDFIFGYDTDFSYSQEIYNIFATHITDYCNEHGVSVTSERISRNASLAVFALNEAIGGKDTANVIAFTFVQSKPFMYAVMASAILIIACVVALDLMNKGRHRKYSYIGMGLISSGYMLFFIPVYVQIKDYITAYKFCSYEPYDKAVNFCLDVWSYILILFGAALLVAGMVMLIKNYNYFKEKNDRALAAKEREELLERDYMKVTKKSGIGASEEKEVEKIDFE